MCISCVCEFVCFFHGHADRLKFTVFLVYIYVSRKNTYFLLRAVVEPGKLLGAPSSMAGTIKAAVHVLVDNIDGKSRNASPQQVQETSMRVCADVRSFSAQETGRARPHVPPTADGTRLQGSPRT